MKNDVQIKVTCLTNDSQKDEFHFDYYDKDGSIVGTVAVDEDGKLGWAIWNYEYQENILDTVSCIFGLKINNSIEYILSSKKPDKMRWERVQHFISSKGLVVNYLQNNEFNRVFRSNINNMRK